LADNHIYALKKVSLENLNVKEKENALNEVRLLASIKHENVIGYRETFVEGNTLCIVMDYASEGDLYQKIVSCKKKKN
jgi:NIMA (never in mitosis gene a)-related kinase